MKKEKPEENNETQVELGKFASVNDLYNAYVELEGEFTRRCQLVKELQKKLDACEDNNGGQASSPAVCAKEPDKQGAADAESAAASSLTDNPEAQISEQCGTSTDRSSAEAESAAQSLPTAIDREQVFCYIAKNAAELADELAELPSVMDACIARYKQKLISLGAISSPQGMAVIVPALKPRTLQEAKRLADEMLK